jgi:hypothetical protein
LAPLAIGMYWLAALFTRSHLYDLAMVRDSLGR